MDAELDLMVELSGEYIRPKLSRFSESLGQWLPGEGDEIENFRITLDTIDITKAVPKSDRERLYNAYLKYKREEHE